jgi:hypothetical protein
MYDRQATNAATPLLRRIRYCKMKATTGGQMLNDSRRLSPPADVAADPKSHELISAWIHAKGVVVMTAGGTVLDEKPDLWGEIVVRIADNIAKSAPRHVDTNYREVLAAIKDKIDQRWPELLQECGDSNGAP